MHKFRAIIRHEYMTIVKQPSFWAIMIGIPVLVGGAIGLSVLANQSSDERVNQLARELRDVTIVDESGLISDEVVKSSGLKLAPKEDVETIRQSVQDGETEGLIVYPENLAESKTYNVYVSSTDFTKSQSIGSLGDTLLETSVYLPLGTTEIIALAKDGAETNLVTYDSGRETAGINEYIVPGAFILLFYIIFAFSVGYMLNSVGEEKENRSMEMVLTYTNERSVIVGKLLAVSLVALTQVLFFAIIGLIGLLVYQSIGNEVRLPLGIDLNRLVFDPETIALATGYLVVGFLMFAGFMTATAAIMPSMKEANSFSTVFFIGAFIPFYFITIIMTDPENPVTTFLTYFPLTSPVVTLIRNTIGNMGSLEAWSALVLMTVFMVLSLWIAIRAFRLGALEFSSRVSLSKLFKR